MRIQKILEVTNLSKKAVYFYIKEGLINPDKNDENGYYDFSEEDLNKLQIINNLRKIGMSIQDIKELFVYPSLTNFFMHRQINNLKKALSEQIEQLQTAYYFIDKLPNNATPGNLDFSLEPLHKAQDKNNSMLDQYFPSIDSRMIAILIWAAFTDIEASEYHNFLWEKISNELSFQLENKLIYLKKIIYSLNPEQIYNASVHMFKVGREIEMAEKDDLNRYADKLFNNCVQIVEDENLRRYWTLIYEPVLRPTIDFFDSEANKLFKEYNPRYSKYSDNMEIICKCVLERLKYEPIILKELIKCLGEEESHGGLNYSHLMCIYSFEGSIFTQLELNKLKDLLS